MSRKIKVQQLDENVNPTQLTLLNLCIILKQVALFENMHIRTISEAAKLSYPATVKLLNGKNQNPKFKTVSSLAEELGFELRFNLMKKKRLSKGEKTIE